MLQQAWFDISNKVMLPGLEMPLLAQLTPQEKWSAARDFQPSSAISEHWMSIALISMLVIMLAMLVAISLRRLKADKQHDEQVFFENVRRHSLSVHEYQLLLAIVDTLKLRHRNIIFRDSRVFEKGSERLVAQSNTSNFPEKERKLRAEIGFLRDKLGLTGLEIPAEDEAVEEATEGTETGRKKHRLSSRELPLGKQLHITRRNRGSNDDFQGTIAANTNSQLEIDIETPVKISFGEVWHARYYFGASVWEFETTVISYDGNRLVLKHSHNVRFVNRRRFVRIPTEHQAFIAPYPFFCMDKAAMEDWTPISFTPATVTELAGPGLRLETALEFKLGEHVLVSFRVDMPTSDEEGNTGYVLNTMGEVKRVEPMYDQFAVSVHVIGLSDRDIDQLVQLTNRVSHELEDPERNTGTKEARPEQVEQDEVLEAVIQVGDTDV